MSAAACCSLATCSAPPVARRSIAPRAAALSSGSSAFASPLRPPRAGASAAWRPAARRAALRVVAGNSATGGPFAPIVVIVRDAMGKKEFNLFRGKAISLHSQVIKEFCKSIGADSKQAQGLIRTAKKNGEKLGFLA